jgi:hypothetical protein
MAFSAVALDAEKYLNRALIQQGSKLPRHYIAKYQENELIFAEDSEGEKFFIVITGRVGIFKGGNGRNQLLHEVSPGQLFGEIALINSMPRARSDDFVAGIYFLIDHLGGSARRYRRRLRVRRRSEWLRCRVSNWPAKPFCLPHSSPPLRQLSPFDHSTMNFAIATAILSRRSIVTMMP